MRGLEFVGDVGGKVPADAVLLLVPLLQLADLLLQLGLAVGALLGLGPGAAGQPGPQRQAHGQGSRGFMGLDMGWFLLWACLFAGGCPNGRPCCLPVYQPR